MYPDQSNPNPDFDFIMGSSQPVKRGRFGSGGGSGGSTKQRVFIVAGLVVGLIIAALIFTSVTGSGNDKGKEEMVDLAAYQTELGRIAGIGMEDGTTTDVKSRAAIVSLTLTTDLTETKSLVKELGGKLGNDDLAKYNSQALDTQFDVAKRANNFDSVYMEVLTEKLNNYKKKLSEVFASQTSPKVQEALRNFKAHADTMSPDAVVTPAP